MTKEEEDHRTLFESYTMYIVNLPWLVCRGLETMFENVYILGSYEGFLGLKMGVSISKRAGKKLK